MKQQRGLGAVEAMIAAALLVTVAVFGGKGPELCAALGGTYTPEAAQVNICPGGDWGKLFQAVQARP